MPVDGHDLERLRRAVALAEKGRFAVEPNPAVGCLIERGGAVVGEGFHLAYGGPHAEIVALGEAGEAARGSTAYVTLEPCSRQGKTGPCTEALVAAGVARVVCAATDPHEAGRGAEALRAAGVRVEGPVEEVDVEALMAPFRWALGARRPWVVLKWAMTLDGRIASGPGRG
ncbi:MAG: bifunctional diaminohydroxyphosphoribosylaminopyrimidine deaminase/5-amino-6-(5-phosphoribosylamino)uracil reductase RibD, partial [Planctomycetota bacterium]